MVNKLFELIATLTVKRQIQQLPVIEWEAIINKIREHINGCVFFLENRKGNFIKPADYQKNQMDDDIISVIVTHIDETLKPWETEQLAEKLRSELSKIFDEDFPILLSRDINSFVGYYVRVRT